MKTLLLFTLLLGTYLGARAQNYYLDLSRQKLDVPGRTVAVDQVLDGRRDSLPIGYVYRGLSNNHLLPVTFRNGVGAELTTLIHDQLPARPTDYRVVLCLRRLYIKEQHTKGLELAEAYLNMDAYMHQPDGYHFLQSVASHVSASEGDVTHLHAGQVTQLVSYTLSQLSTQADWETALVQPARTLAQLPTDEPVALPSRAEREPLPPILREAPRRGIYRSFAQFLANQPDISQAFRIDTVQPQLRSYLAMYHWNRVPWVRPMVADAQGHWAVPVIWGFSDGQALFVRRGEYFFPLLRQGRFFTTVGNAPFDSPYANADEAGIAQASDMLTTFNNLSNTSDVPVGYAVDMRSGKLERYPGLRAPTRPDTAYVYVYRPARAAGPPQMQVWLNSKKVGELRPGEYLELPWPYYATLFSLCLIDESQGSACQHVIPDVKRPNFLRVTFSPEAPLWQWVPAEEGLADLDELDKRRGINR